MMFGYIDIAIAEMIIAQSRELFIQAQVEQQRAAAANSAAFQSFEMQRDMAQRRNGLVIDGECVEAPMELKQIAP